jgi:hypothetical protein
LISVIEPLPIHEAKREPSKVVHHSQDLGLGTSDQIVFAPPFGTVWLW